MNNLRTMKPKELFTSLHIEAIDNLTPEGAELLRRLSLLERVERVLKKRIGVCIYAKFDQDSCKGCKVHDECQLLAEIKGDHYGDVTE